MSNAIDIAPVMKEDSFLTGKFRFRTNWAGKLILQVQYEYYDYEGDSSTKKTNWRDAKVEDLTLLEPSN